MTINEIAEDIIKREDYQLAKAFTMCISSLLLSKGVQPVIHKTEKEFSENDDISKYISKYIIRKEYNVTFDIDMTEHDKEIYNKACNDMLFILKEMRETTQAMMQPDLEYACDRFIEQVEKLKK